MKHKASRINRHERREQDETAQYVRELLKPTKLQAVAQAAYCGGEMDHLKREQFDSAGDSLFTFIMSELDEDCEDLAQAVGRLEAARDQIEHVITTLARKG